jgi:hypothetical protein
MHQAQHAFAHVAATDDQQTRLAEQGRAASNRVEHEAGARARAWGSLDGAGHNCQVASQAFEDTQ